MSAGRPQSKRWEATHGAFYVLDHPRQPMKPEGIVAELASLRTLAETGRIQTALLRRQRDEAREQRDEAMRALGRSRIETIEIQKRAALQDATIRSLQAATRIAPAIAHRGRHESPWPHLRAMLIEWHTINELVEMTGMSICNVRVNLLRHINELAQEYVPGQNSVKRWRLKEQSQAGAA